MESVESLDDLLTGPLAQFKICFEQAGFDDFEFIMSCDYEEWERMMDSVQLEAQELGILLKEGHKMQIIARLKAELVHRSEFDRYASPFSRTALLRAYICKSATARSTS